MPVQPVSPYVAFCYPGVTPDQGSQRVAINGVVAEKRDAGTRAAAGMMIPGRKVNGSRGGFRDRTADTGRVAV